MSGRGARGRKAIQKDIEKKEKKAATKNKAKEEPYDAFAEWTPSPSLKPNNLTAPTRTLTISSDVSRTTSRSNSTTGSRPRLHTLNSNHSSELKSSSRPKTSASGSYSHSDVSSKGKEKTKYQAKGKETKAPRGRGGGVPMKTTAAASLAPPNGARAPSATPTVHLSPNQRTWINFRVWAGEDSGVRPYGGFDFDVDMQDGNVLVYFKEEQANDEVPVPQIRADLEVLENAGSTWLSNALLYGRIDDNDDDWAFPGSSEAPLSMRNYLPADALSGQRRMLSPISPEGRSPPPFDIDQYGVPLSGNTTRAGFYPEVDRNFGTPPPFQGNISQKPTHELWFTAPTHLKTPHSQRLHHVAVRNFLALLHDKPIVGTDLFEMLSTLQPEIQVMYDLDQDNQSRMTPRERSVHMIVNYLTRSKLDDPRTSIKNALALLAWSEQDTVKWRQGYLENFVHLAGVITPEIEELPDFKRLTMMTRRNLGIAAKTLQLRIMEAEEKLETFDFSELWEDNAKAAGSPIYQNYQSFRQFLISHYTKMYGNWPPTNKKTWLNRRIVLALQDDFGALYDYLVNRDVMWDPREARPGKKWEMSHRKDEDFKADLPELSLTDMLVKFDNKHSFARIPHPYPLLPRQVQKSTKEKEKRSLFNRFKKGEDKDNAKDAKAHLQLSIVFSDATNLEKEDVDFNGSRLIDQFEQFELTTNLKHDTPREARLGRWVLLYGILQVLSTLSVDVQSLKYTEGVRYFLCTDLKRCPDWVTIGQAEYLEASQQRSWCWQRPWDPTPIRGAPSELDASNVARRELDAATLVPSRSSDSTMQLNQDIQRIGEKIEHMSLSHNANRMMREELDRRRENEKVMQQEFSIGDRKRMDDGSYRLTESDFIGNQYQQLQLQSLHPQQQQLHPLRPLAPHRRPPLREPVASMVSDAGFFLSSNSFPTPPGYRTAGATAVRGGGGYYAEEQPGMF